MSRIVLSVFAYETRSSLEVIPCTLLHYMYILPCCFVRVILVDLTVFFMTPTQELM